MEHLLRAVDGEIIAGLSHSLRGGQTHYTFGNLVGSEVCHRLRGLIKRFGDRPPGAKGDEDSSRYLLQTVATIGQECRQHRMVHQIDDAAGGHQLPGNGSDFHRRVQIFGRQRGHSISHRFQVF